MTKTTAPKYDLSTCSMLVELSISAWTARKLDRKTTDEVVTDKNAAAKDAARVNKYLLAGRTELDVINQMATKARQYIYDNTLPWSDSGLRLLPTVNFMKFSARMNEFDDEFTKLVTDFVQVYPTLITAQAMALGDMFKRDDFPSASEIMTKFSFRVNYMPVPAAGDFRVDVGTEAQKELRERLEQVAQERVDAAMADVRARLGEHMKRMSDRLTVDWVAGEAKPRRFHDSLVEGALGLCDIVKALNVTQDPEVEHVRKELESLLVGVTPEELRKNDAVRTDVKKNVDAILGKFNF